MKFSIKNFILNFCAVASDISMFNWYISFYVVALLSFPVLDRILNYLCHCGITKIVFIIAIFIGLRFISKMLYQYNIIGVSVYNFFSHYNVSMPEMLFGSTVYQYGLYSKWSKGKKEKMNLLISIVFLALLTGARIFFDFGINVGSKLEVFWVIGEVYSWTVIAKYLLKSSICSKVFSVLGKYSLYIWLIHAVFFEDFMQPFIYGFRLPALIILIALLLCLLLAFPLHKFDSFIIKRITIVLDVINERVKTT